MYFAAICLAPLIHRVLSVSVGRLLLPVKANICDIIYQKNENVKWEKGKTFGKGGKESVAGVRMSRIPRVSFVGCIHECTLRADT